MDLQEIYKALRSEYDGKTWSDEFLKIHVTLMRDGQIICWFDLDKDDEGFEEKRDCAISFYDEVVRFLVDRFGEEFKYEDPRISDGYIDRNNIHGQYEIVLDDDDGENAPVIAIWENEESEMRTRFNESLYGVPGAEDVDWAIIYKNCHIEPSEFYGNLGELYDEEHPEDPNHRGFEDWCWENTDLIESELEHLAGYDDNYEGDYHYAESRKLVKEGAGAGYTVTIKDLKLGSILEKKYMRMKKDYESYWECQVEVMPGEYEIEASDYYNDFFWQEHEFGDTPTAKIDGGIATISYSTNSYDEDEAEDELRREVARRTMDVSFDYGWGWTHADLPREKIEADHVDASGEFYGSIDKLELNAPDLADAVNNGFQSTFDQGEEDAEEDEDGEQMDESTKNVVKESSEDFERFFKTLKIKFRKDGCNVNLRDNEDGTVSIEIDAPIASDGKLFDFIKRKCESNNWFFERDRGGLLVTYSISESENEEPMDESYAPKGDDGKKRVMDALDEFTQVLWDDTKVKGKKEHELRQSFFDETVHAISTAIQKYFKYTRI